jgi:hydroxymethylpyrimidine pyrophosphatase-like HAD family hydrolase/GTPase SAR1 family protein
MQYIALACDYDGTLATDGRVGPPVLAALTRLRESGRRLIMVTGREMPDLKRVLPEIELFDLIVAENGALLYRPATRESVPLAPPPPPRFAEMLVERKVEPLSVGEVIVATWEPNETAVLETIRDLGLELQIIFNKGAVMVLPAGVNKGSGLKAALAELGLSAHNVVGVGDAENDHAFLSLCGCGVAVGNALDAVKETADLVTKGERGTGVVELIELMVETDLAALDSRIERHRLRLGEGPSGPLEIAPLRANLLVAGTSGAGKSTLTTALLERMMERSYQFCVADPEGDYGELEGALAAGEPSRAVTVPEVMELLEKPDSNVVANMLGIPLADRPGFFVTLLPELLALRARSARPHWIVIDEAHHMLPATRDPGSLALPDRLEGALMVTVHPDQVHPAALRQVNHLLVIGQEPQRIVETFCRAVEREVPAVDPTPLERGELLVWDLRAGTPPQRARFEPPKGEHRRHTRKYAEGKLGEDISFYFRGPERKLKLRVQNLSLFVQIADGVDDDTWAHHLRAGDYSRWFREVIKDPELAEEAAEVEQQEGLAPADSRARIREAIEKRYTAPAAG